jgi:hypothetical protein
VVNSRFAALAVSDSYILNWKQLLAMYHIERYILYFPSVPFVNCIISQ